MDAHPGQQDQHILVVEADPGLGHVVALTLEHHGLPIHVYRSLADAWEDVQTPPALVVFDAGPAPADEWDPLRALVRHRQLGAAPVVLLAWACALDDTRASSQVPRVCLAKPFDARALDDAATELLSPRHDNVSLSANRPSTSALDPAAEADEPAPPASMWPLVTAGGGFAAVVGFMIHPVYVVGGLLIMLVALLRWALEPANSRAHV